MDICSKAPPRKQHNTSLKTLTHLERNECVDGGGRAWYKKQKEVSQIVRIRREDREVVRGRRNLTVFELKAKGLWAHRTYIRVGRLHFRLPTNPGNLRQITCIFYVDTIPFK